MGTTAPWRKLAVVSLFVGVGFALTLGLILGMSNLYESSRNRPKPWNSSAVKATYVGTQLKQIDKANAGLFFYYDLENNTALDYQFSDTPSLIILSKLKSSNTLNSEQNVRIAYPVFLPARQRARIVLEVLHPFEWPAQTDPESTNKFKVFVNQRVANLEQFVLFDQTSRCQIEFPRGWQELSTSKTQEN